MTDSPSPAPPAARWGLSIAVALLGSWILWNAELGINWPLWLATASIALIVVAHRRYGGAGTPAVVAAAWAVILASGTAITTAGGWHALLLAGSVLFFSIALAAAGERSLDALRPRLAVAAPFGAIAAVFGGVIGELSDRAGAQRLAARSSVTRSVLITAPVIIVLVLLLANADPFFAALRSALENLVPIDDPARIFFFFFLLALSIGVLGTVARGASQAPVLPEFGGLAIGRLESRVLASSMAVVMWLFVASATISFFRNPAARTGSGVTYADYAHRGFAELNVAAALVIGAILTTRRTWERDDRLVWRAAVAALAGVGGMLVIAFLRLVRYEQAYGFTYQRLQAQGFMLLLACAIAFLAAEVVRRAPSLRFAYRTMTAALVIGMASVYFNTDAWIVRRNVDLYQKTGVLDVSYLTTNLSGDAIPAIAASVPRLHEPERTAIDTVLRGRASSGASHHARWFAWNLRARQRAKALDAYVSAPTPPPAAP